MNKQIVTTKTATRTRPDNIQAVPVISRGKDSYAAYLKTNKCLSENDKQAILNKRFIDAVIYKSLTISGLNRVEVFKANDDLEIGITNINGGRLPKGEPFTATGMVLLSSIAAGEEWDDIRKSRFGIIHEHIRNGHFSLKIGGDQIVAERINNEVFVTHSAETKLVLNDGTLIDPLAVGSGTAVVSAAQAVFQNADRAMGFYQFDNPFTIPTDTFIDLVVEWGSAAPANAALKVMLVGGKMR